MKGQREYEERNLLVGVGVIGAFALFVQIGDSHKNSTWNRWRYQHYGWITDGQDDPYIKGYADDLCWPKEEGHTQRYIRQKPSKINKYRAMQQPTITCRYRVGGLFFILTISVYTIMIDNVILYT